MDKGSKFDRDVRKYEVLQDGTEHVEGNATKCIQPPNSRNCVTIKRAITDKLIREVSSSGPTDGSLLHFGQGDQEIQSEQGGQEVQVAQGEKVEQPADRGLPLSPEPITPEMTEPEPLRTKNDNVYYMPADNLRAQVYLAHGLIYPGVYDKAGLSAGFDDSQRQSPADLTLFKDPQPLKKNQLLLKILLQHDEVTNAKCSGNMLRFPLPLPISRLVGIEVPLEIGDLDRFIDGWIKPDVPVPRHLFSISKVQSTESYREHAWSDQKEKAKPIPGLSDTISRFNSYLGVMAFLRNGDRYFSEQTGYYADYPAVFFSVFEKICAKSVISNSIHESPDPFLLSLLDLETSEDPAAAPVMTLVRSQEPYVEKKKARSLANEIYQCTGKKESLRHAFKSLFNDDYRAAIQMLQGSDLPKEAAVLAALFKFSARQAGDHRTVKHRLHEDWSNHRRAHLALAALGAYHGYTVMDAHETALYSAHPLIRPLIEECSHIKFHLISIFERQLIEALYRHAFFPMEAVHDSSELFEGIRSSTASVSPQVSTLLVSDKTYNVQDLLVHRYEVTTIGRMVQKLKAWKKDIIDEKSEVGKCLMSQCFFYANEYESSMKAGKQNLRYQIEKSRVIDLIAEGKVAINPRVLEVALEEDFENYAQ